MQEVMDSETKTVDKEMISVHEGAQQSHVCMSDEQCRGLRKDDPPLGCTCVYRSPPLPMNVIRGSDKGPSISQNRKILMRQQLRNMLGDSCILLEKANTLKEQARLLFQENNEYMDHAPSGIEGVHTPREG